MNWEVVADNFTPEVGLRILILASGQPEYMNKTGIVRGLYHDNFGALIRTTLTVRLDGTSDLDGLINMTLYGRFDWADYIKLVPGT